MEYITANVDLKIIQNDAFVKMYWTHITKMANADEAVCLTDKLDDGK